MHFYKPADYQPCYYCEKIEALEEGYPIREGIYTYEKYVYRCGWHARFECSKCGEQRHFDWLYWCPSKEELVCGDCNKPSMKPVRFWDRTYAYEYNCEDCGESHFGLPYAEFQGKHPWQLGNRSILSNVELPEPWDPLWSPKKHREGQEIELAEVLKLPNRVVQLREDVNQSGSGFGILRYAIPESQIDYSEGKDQWESNAEHWIDFNKVEMSGDPNRRYVIDPALWNLIGDVNELSVLDAGCGNGYLTRELATKGASVVGVDYSKPFIEYCKKIEGDLKQGCKFIESSITDMNELESKSFDLVVSNVVMVDVLDYKTAFKEIARILKDDGRFIWSNTHPVFGSTSSAVDVKIPNDSKRNESRYLKMIDRYFDSGGELIEWMTSPTWQIRRTLEEYSKALKGAGFVISEIQEPRPSIDDIQQNPAWLAFDADRWTHFIIFECLKR